MCFLISCASFFCNSVDSAEAAVVAEPEPAGFGPEGGQGAQGGTCTGDLLNLLSNPPYSAYTFTYRLFFFFLTGTYVISQCVKIPPSPPQTKGDV